MKKNEFSYTWLSDPEVFEVNRQPVHADFDFYADNDEYQKQKTRLKQSLNGMWKNFVCQRFKSKYKGF